MTLRSLAILVSFLLVRTVSAQEIGLQLESFRTELATDPASAMKKVKDLGFSQVEMGNTYGLSFPQFIKLLAVNGLSVVSFQTSYEQLTQSPNEVIEQARSYGARYIVCSPGENRLTTALGAEKTADVLNQAGKLVAQSGLLLCYRPLAADFATSGTATYFDHLLDHLMNGVVYIAMDVAAVKNGGKEPVELLRKHPTRFVLMYLGDRVNAQKNTSKDSTVTLGAGDVGIREVMTAARELGISNFFMQDNSANAAEHISEGLAWLRTIEDHSRK